MPIHCATSEEHTLSCGLFFTFRCFYFLPPGRLEKEVQHYQKEVVENEAEWKRVEADPTKDEYDAKRYRDIWEESVRMVPDAERRYQSALQDLSAHVQQYFANVSDDDDDSNNNEWLVVARQILASQQQSANNATSKDGDSNGGGLGGEATQVDDLAEGEAF